MEAWSRLTENHSDRLLLVAMREIDPQDPVCAQQRSQVRILLDGHGETARRYHALWLPRAYALDERGRLAYAQPTTTLDPQAPLQVAARWGQSRPPVALREGGGLSARLVATSRPLPGRREP